MSKMTDKSHKLQSILDEHKQEIPDQLYLQMSNICMEGHNEENETEGFYKVTYVYNKTTQDAQDSTLFRTHYIPTTQIVKIQHNLYTEIDHVLKNEGYCIGRNFSRSFAIFDLAHEEVFIRFTVGVDDAISDCADE
jgi:hypothetical protein